MKWIKINRNCGERIPDEEFLVTDDKEIDIKINTHSMFKFSRNKIKVEDATHYILLSDIQLPNQPERSKREDVEHCTPDSDCRKYGCR